MKSFQGNPDNYKVLRVFPDRECLGFGLASFEKAVYRCALGQTGIGPCHRKKEGDGKTPAGLYFPKRLFYREDRIESVTSPLPLQTIRAEDGWCDDPASRDYNRLVRLPSHSSHEKMCREDHLYDLVLIISHNDAPVRAGLGSAVFFHIAQSGLVPTRGCVAFRKSDFLDILKTLTPDTLIRIHTRPRAG